MPVIVTMLGVAKIGDDNKTKSEQRPALYESLGLGNPQSINESGKVFFRTKERN